MSKNTNHSDQSYIPDDENFDFSFDDDELDQSTKSTESIDATFDDDTNNNINSSNEQQYNEKIEENQGQIDTQDIEDNKSKSKKTIFKPKEAEKKTLYMVADKVNNQYIEYFRGHGVNISNICYKLDDIRGMLIMAINKVRLILVETGSGKFTSVSARKELVDIVGLASEDIEISIFYTDNIVKKEIDYADGIDTKHIKWFKFRSTADVLANTLQLAVKNKEIYELDTMAENIKHKSKDEALQFKGITMDYKSEPPIPALLSFEEIMGHHRNMSEAEEIEGYNVVY